MSTLETAARSYSDNLRKFRRYMQGKGINLRETVVVADAYADVRIAVPGLLDDDAIVSVINLTDAIDVTGWLDDAPKHAALTVFSVNKGIAFTAIKGGTEGNNIYVKAAAAPGASLPLSVTIGAYDAVLGTTGHPGKTVILVNLATDGSGVVLSTSANSAANVRAAVIDAQEAMVGDAIVTAALTGTGGTAWTAQSVVPLTGGSDFKQGPSTAVLVTDLDDTSPYTESSDLRYTARVPGVLGNDISVIYAAGSELGVAVSDEQITVTYVVGVTTAKQVMDAVNADANAAHLVKVSLGPGAGDGDGVVATMAESFLAGGADGGIQFSAATDTPLSAKSLKVLWVTRGENTPAGEA